MGLGLQQSTDSPTALHRASGAGRDNQRGGEARGLCPHDAAILIAPCALQFCGTMDQSPTLRCKQEGSWRKRS